MVSSELIGWRQFIGSLEAGILLAQRRMHTEK